MSAYSDAVMALNPVAYWRLGEPSDATAFDETGTNDGTYTGTPTLGVTGALTGDSDTAVTLGTGKYITVPDHASLDLGDGPLTYICWFKMAGPTGDGNQVLLSKGAGSMSLEVTAFVGGVIQWYIRSVAVLRTSSVVLSSDTNWHFVAATHDGVNDKIYLDGADVTVFVEDNTASSTSVALNIGRDVETADANFSGSMDEVALFDAILTGPQVATLYAAGTRAAVLLLGGL